MQLPTRVPDVYLALVPPGQGPVLPLHPFRTSVAWHRVVQRASEQRTSSRQNCALPPVAWKLKIPLWFGQEVELRGPQIPSTTPSQLSSSPSQTSGWPVRPSSIDPSQSSSRRLQTSWFVAVVSLQRGVFAQENVPSLQRSPSGPSQAVPSAIDPSQSLCSPSGGPPRRNGLGGPKRPSASPTPYS